jgi:hypothetical protein
MRDRKFDWQKFLIHGFFGAILGTIAGYTVGFFIGFFLTFNELWTAGAGALVYGAVAGLKGDDFWSGFGG